jgi:hypothetical protein
MTDGKQLIAQRARDFFGDRLEDVLYVVRQDRQELRGWDEPAHLRSVVRRVAREGTTEDAEDEGVVALADGGRTNAEGERTRERESLSQLLDAGVAALQKLRSSATPDLTGAEGCGLETVLLLYGRPSLQLVRGRMAGVPPLWNVLEDQREAIETAQRGVGRIELYGHPEFDWAGTGFLAGESALVTTRRTAELFVEQRDGQWQFRPGITAWMNYRPTPQRVAAAGCRVRGVVGVHPIYDLAVLQVEAAGQTPGAPIPLPIAAQAPTRLEGRQAFLIGYPVRDARRGEPEAVSRIFRDTYNVKRVMPGLTRGTMQFRDVQLIRHDCATLGQVCGGPVVDLETNQVLGVHQAGRYLEASTAIPLWMLRDDPMFRQAGVVFAQNTGEQLRQASEQLERLARTRFWPELQNTIQELSRRAFGADNGLGANGLR